MSIELKMLLFSAILLILQLVFQAVAGILQNGIGYAMSARDEAADTSGYAARFERAFYNMLETFPVFAALALMVHVSESWNQTTALGAQLYFWARVLYVPAYVSAVPLARTVIWTVSIVGISMMAWVLLQIATG